MNISGLLQSKWIPKRASLTLQETQSIYDSMNIPKNWIHFLNDKDIMICFHGLMSVQILWSMVLADSMYMFVMICN